MRAISLYFLISLCSQPIFSAPQFQPAINPNGPAVCKPTPSSPDWPSDRDWRTLYDAVKGRLLKPNAPAAACHRGPLYNEDQCEQVQAGWADSEWHIRHPTSNMWQNYNNYSCMPEARGPCSTAGYPVWVVAAKEANDVKYAVDFARTFNLRLNIKSTGHDFLGRSVQPNSLSIWTHALNSQRWWDTSFTPKGCRAPINGPAVTVGSGSQWRDIYRTADQRGVSLVGGRFASVSVGGYLANGGHGLLSAKYGLGADMVLEIELVTADGEIITANECQNTDYFWAMRGGGGSTYGVVLSYTIQGLRLGPMAKYSGTVSGWNQIAYLHSQWPRISRAGGAGYITGYPGRGGAVTFSVNMPNTTSMALQAIINPILQGLRKRSIDTSDDADVENNSTTSNANNAQQNTGKYMDFPNFEALRRDAEVSDEQHASGQTFPGMGSNKIITSWLWSEKDVASPQLKNALYNSAPDGDAQLYNDATMGVGTHNPPYIRGGGNAVNSAFRTAIMRPAAELQWSGTDPRQLAKRQNDALRYLTALRALAPEGGTYANEAYADTPDWQHAFWGSNYERLFAIKRKVDPRGLFWCRACVGSELWEDRAGVLCRR